MNQLKLTIALVDDDALHSNALADILTSKNFEVDTFSSATEFLKTAVLTRYDLLISDINMPGESGFDLCRTLRANAESVRLPIVLITGSDVSVDKVQGLEAGADDFISKPIETKHLLAKINSLLNIRSKEMDRLQELQSTKGLNAELGKFLSPNIADRLTVDGRQSFLEPHRSEVTVLFVDLRQFTSFSEKFEPEEVLEVLREYYTVVGAAALKHKGTLGHLAGDGIMIFFNDPEPIPDHMGVAVRMAMDAREALLERKKIWDERQYGIDFGMGLSVGYATIGEIGFDKFSQYSVIGSVANFASRLCHLATDGQILVSLRFSSRLKENTFKTESIGKKTLKGIEKVVSVYNITGLKENQGSDG